MSICFKCKKSIKPASLATTLAGEKYHPTCITCAICELPIWGKPFKKTSDGKQLICEKPCSPSTQPTATSTTISPIQRPLSAQRQQQQIIINQINETYPQNKTDLSMYKKPLANLQQFDIQSNNHNNQSINQVKSKECKICNQSLINKRFITYENEETLCEECVERLNQPIPRIKSAHLIVCSICNITVKGTKYYTEANGDIICENCDSNAPRCTKCKIVFKLNDNKISLNSNGLQFHSNCLDCNTCKNPIRTKEFFQDETGLPICLTCFEISKLPKCSSCNKHITEAYIIIENKPIHETCFKCKNCNNLLNKDLGYFKNKITNEPICESCNIKLNGSKCVRCMQVIEKDGVTFSDKDYHQDCFKCDECKTELVKMKKTLTDKSGQNLYCEPCFIKMYAPKCSKCNEIISPYIPGTVYEDKNFHKECFACNRCKRTLSNKKFFKVGNLLICENCY